jgi:sulfate adenylyltransferase large subunit
VDLLRLSTVGSVDDGKSTLIGRLLFDSKGIFEDQLAAVERASRSRGRAMDLALLTDGLRAEREEGITIDVAYRYFATPRRTFILADTPGHFEFTRNMVTGASTADVAVVLVDVTRGIVEQSRRHATIASMLRVPQIIVCVNKMDLVGYSEAAFEDVRESFATFIGALPVRDVTYVPVSALHGDNVVERSSRMPWYEGPALLALLEGIEVPGRESLPPRFPIQLVIVGRVDGGERPALEYAGRVEGGAFRVGDEVGSLATGRRAQVARIRRSGRDEPEAVSPMSAGIALTPELDLARGDMLVSGSDEPAVARRVAADLCWMAERPLAPGTRYVLKHTTRSVSARCSAINHRYDFNTHQRDTGAGSLDLNEIGSVEFETDEPLFVDRYADNRTTGSFIVIDRQTNDTVAAGMIEAAR